MNCFYCKGSITDDTTTYMTDLGTCIIIIKNVPCHKCSQCGEISYNGEVVLRIEKIIDKLKDTLTEIAVVYYDDKVA